MSLRMSMTLESYDEQHVGWTADVSCGLDRGPLCGHSDLCSGCTNVRFCGSHILHQPFRVQRFHHSTSVRERPKLRGVWAVPSSR